MNGTEVDRQRAFRLLVPLPSSPPRSELTGLLPSAHLFHLQIIQHVGVDYIDESEVLTPADEQHHINKHTFKIPFVCGCRDLGEALRRISEGAAMIRTKGEAGTGNIVEAVRHERRVMGEIRRASAMTDEELYAFAKELGAPYHLLKETARLKRLPVVSHHLALYS